MRIAALILAVLGAIFSLMLGMKWQSDYSKYKDLKDASVALAESVGAAGGDRAELDAASAQFESTGTAAKMLMVAAVLGVAGAVLVVKRMYVPAAAALAAGGILPAVFAVQSLLTCAFLLIAAAPAFLASRKSAPALKVPVPATA